MARPQRNNVDYFPFYCEEGKKMYYLEETYGNDGFAVFIKLLRELAKTDYHYLDLSKNTTQMFLSAKCKVSKQLLLNIINDLVELEKFDSVLWNENNIIWCQDFIDSIQDAYIKRKNKCISYEGLISLLIGLGVRKQSKLPLTGVGNPQSKVEYSKIKKSESKNALTFLKSHLSKWEVIQMQNKKRFNGDWDRMLELFSYKVDEEELKYEWKILNARLMRWMDAWTNNNRKSTKKTKPLNSAEQKIKEELEALEK